VSRPGTAGVGQERPVALTSECAGGARLYRAAYGGKMGWASDESHDKPDIQNFCSTLLHLYFTTRPFANFNWPIPVSRLAENSQS
jgi:hypothetical protein